MAQETDPLDPKGLIVESYRIDGIGTEECRSIFLDWALSLPVDADTDAARAGLVARYLAVFPDHPMTAVLREGQGQSVRPRRRGGWRARDRG